MPRARVGMTREAISKLVQRLFQKEFVERTNSESDRRYQSVALTAKAAKLVPKLAQLAGENDREFFGYLAMELQNDLIRLLKDVVHRQGWKDVPVS